MKIEIDNKQLALLTDTFDAALSRIEKRAEDALVIAQEFASGSTKEISKLSASIESLKNSSSIPTDYAQRLTRLEAQFAELHAKMTEVSPTTGKTKLSKFGQYVAKR